MTPRALWVVPTSEVGGVARHVLDVARAGLPGWQLSVAAPPGPLTMQLSRLGCEVHPVKSGGAQDNRDARPCVIGEVRQAAAQLRSVITDLRPQVVHSHLARADLLCQIATIGLPVTLASTEHGIAPPGTYHSGRLASGLRRLSHGLRLRRAPIRIAVSQSTATLMQQLWHSPQPVVIHNGIDRRPDSAQSNSEDQQGFRFLSLARLSPEKNLDLVLAAFSQVAAEVPEATLTVAGTGPLVIELQTQTAELGIADRVSFPGVIPAEEAMGSHDVLVQPSAWENCSYFLLDAAANGLGIVATNVGGNAEFLPRKILLTKPTPESIAAQMLNQAAHLKQRACLPVDWPTISAMTRHIVACYGRPDGVELRHQSG